MRCYSSKGEDLILALSSADPNFVEKNLSAKPIDEYKPNIYSVGADIPRIKKFSLHKNDLTREYTQEKMAEILATMGGKNSNENKERFAKEIIELITDDPFMQAYLYSEFHQSGIQRISAAMLTEPPLKSIGQHATPIYNAVDVTTIDQENIKIFSQAVFSDQILCPEDMSKFPQPEIPSPLFVCNVELDIKLIDNPDDANTKKISITPSLEIYVVPGGEALFERAYQGFVDKFEKKSLPIESILPEKIALIKDNRYKSDEKKPLSSSDEEEAESLDASTSDLDPEDFVNIDVKKIEKKPISSSDEEDFEIIDSPPQRQKQFGILSESKKQKEEKPEENLSKSEKFRSFFKGKKP